MIIETLAVAAGEAAPQNQFGFMEAMEQGGVIAWTIFGVLVIMSVGSFYILITKWLEQQKILNQYKDVRSNFWRANSLRDGAATWIRVNLPISSGCFSSRRSTALARSRMPLV